MLTTFENKKSLTYILADITEDMCWIGSESCIPVFGRIMPIATHVSVFEYTSGSLKDSPSHVRSQLGMTV